MGAEFLVQNRMGRVSDILNDWDLLLPSGGPYGNDEADDEDMTENERWKKQQLSRRGWESTRGQGIILGSLTILAVLVKIWKLAVPSAVVNRDTSIVQKTITNPHLVCARRFGGFTRDYLNGSFFMGVHSPLGKMLFSPVAYSLGFDGKFDFATGKLYPKNVPYISMRMFAASCGVLLVPISYLIMKRSGHSTQASMMCAIFVIF
ncbi:hypothetical protein BGZ54_000896, partial [Gamsiella multidivaricata]